MIFTYIETISNRLTDAISTAAVSPQVNILQSIVLGYITVWVMAKGYMILAGKNEEPFKALIYDAAIKAIIITVVFSPTWINLVTSAIDGLNEWASGGVSLYARLDSMYQQVINIGAIMEDQDGKFEFTGLICQFGVLFSFAIVAVASISIIIVAAFTLKILIMIAPIMMFTLMFDWFKSIFERWLQLVLNNTLTVLFIGVTFNILSDEYETVINQYSTVTQSGSIDTVSIMSDIFFTSLIIVVLILLVREIAQQLTHVSIESLAEASGKKVIGNATKPARTAAKYIRSKRNRK